MATACLEVELVLDGLREVDWFLGAAAGGLALLHLSIILYYIKSEWVSSKGHLPKSQSNNILFPHHPPFPQTPPLTNSISYTITPTPFLQFFLLWISAPTSSTCTLSCVCSSYSHHRSLHSMMSYLTSILWNVFPVYVTTDSVSPGIHFTNSIPRQSKIAITSLTLPFSEVIETCRGDYLWTVMALTRSQFLHFQTKFAWPESRQSGYWRHPYARRCRSRGRRSIWGRAIDSGSILSWNAISCPRGGITWRCPCSWRGWSDRIAP